MMERLIPTLLNRSRLSITAAIMIAFGILVGAPTTRNVADVDHCISPSGLDLNERYGLSTAILAPCCNEMGSGQARGMTGLWVVSNAFDAVPEEFIAAGPTPADDFVAKFVQARVVVDQGTRHEKSYAFLPATAYLRKRMTEWSSSTRSRSAQ